MSKCTIRDVFIDCQKGLHSHGKLVKNLWKIHDQMDFDKFWEEFMDHVKYSMIVLKREPAVERTLEFISKFCTSSTDNQPKPTGTLDGGETSGALSEDEDEVELHPVLQRFFEFILNNHNARDRAVRFRCCMMINKLLNNMGDEAQLDDALYDRIYECMLQRLRDKFPIVRVQAVLAMGRLQDPTDQDCPVIAAYLFLMSCDINADVRRATLSSIAASTKTLGPILERTRDVKDPVRRLAFNVISEKIHIRALTIAQRVRLLHDGLNDRVESVQEACASRLLQAWLRTFEGNILDLMKCIDVENSLETAEQTLKVLFKKSPVADLVQNFDLLDENLVLPFEQLTCENSLYWQMLCEHISGQGPTSEEWLEKVLPNATMYCGYIRQVLEHFSAEEDLELQLRNEFILQRLLNLAGVLDISDEVGRRCLKSLIHDMLVHEKVSHVLVKSLLCRYNNIITDPEGRVNQLVEITSEIREPITMVDQSVTADEQRKTDLKIASIRVEVNQLRDELDTCVANQDFGRAAEIKARISELDGQRQIILDDAMPKSQEVRTEKTDSMTLMKCLMISCEMLQDTTLRTLIPSLQTLMETLIIPGVTNSDPAVRNLAVKTLGLCCLLKKDTAAAHLLLFIQVSQMDQERIQVSALQVIFDLLHTFGLDAFQVSEQTGDETTPSSPASSEPPAPPSPDSSLAESEQGDGDAPSEGPPNTARSVLTILNSLLDSESSEIRTVCAEGLAKLLLSGRLVSPKLFSRLVLLWYNPVTEDDNHLRHCLGSFFLVYAFAGRTNMEVVEEAFLPTLRTLFNAPAASPLTEVNISNAAELLVQLTDIRHLVNKPPDTIDTFPHDGVALKISNEILSEPNSFNVRVLGKVLNTLEVCPKNETAVKDLMVLAHRMIKEVKDKPSNKMIQKFKAQMKSHFTKLCNEKGIPMEVEGEDETADTTKMSATVQDEEAQAAGDRTASTVAGVHLSESEMENSVFASPAPVKRMTRGRKPKSTAASATIPKMNLSALLSDSDGEAPAAKESKTATKEPESTAKEPESAAKEPESTAKEPESTAKEPESTTKETESTTKGTDRPKTTIATRKSSRTRQRKDGDERSPLSGLDNAAS